MKNFYLIFLAIISVININAQSWNFFKPSNTGLPSDNVLSIATDDSGNKWFGTKSGLVRFDGEVWTNYNTLNSDLPSNTINAIAIDKNGKMWIGTKAGLVIFDEHNCTVFNRSNSGLPCDTITDISIDGYGNKWIGIGPAYLPREGYRDGGLIKYDNTSWVRYSSLNSELPSNYITSIEAEATGIIWIGTYEGLAKLDGDKWSTYNIDNSSLPTNKVSSIAIDKNNIKWVGLSYFDYYSGHCYHGEGIAKFDDNNWQYFNVENSGLPSNNIFTIEIDNSNNKWVGTANGFVKYKNSIWEEVNIANFSYPHNKVNCIGIDKEGNKWISILTDEWDSGYMGAGIAKYNDSNWTFYTHAKTGLCSKWINSLVIDEQGNKWLGNWDGGGLTKFDGKVWTNYNRSNSNIPADTIPDLVLDNLGNLWLATYKGGLSKFDGKTWTNYNTSNSKLPSDIVYCITIDKFGNKWIGTKDGLAMFDDIDWTIYNINWVSSICIDEEDNKWIGTSGNGIYKYDGQDWVNYTVFNSELRNNWISDIAIDKYGNIWIINPATGSGSTGNGALIKIDKNKWTVYDTYNSDFQNNRFQSIFIDELNTIWVGRNIEFSRLYCDNITHYPPPTSVSELKFIASIAKDKAGVFWLGTLGGLIKFYNYPELEDDMPPSMTCIESKTVEAGDVNGYTVTGTELDIIDATDNCAIESLINDFNDNSTLEGAILPEGTNNITWTLIDKAGNTNLCNFNVIVNPYVGIETIYDYGINIYPNPVSRILNFNFGTNNIKNITIIDVAGNIVLELQKVKQFEKVNVSNLSEGLYFAIIQLNNKKLVHKIVKKR